MDSKKPIWGAAGRLLWIDLETTGLNPKADKILEVGLAVTGPAPNFELMALKGWLVSPPRL